MSRNPFHYAFTLSFFGVVFVVLGLLGCRLRKDPFSVVACGWSESPWWNEVWIGAAMVAVSLIFWRRALASLDAPTRPKS